MKRLSLVVVISLIAATTLHAQVAERSLPVYTYAAKFVCGQVPSPPTTRVPLPTRGDVLQLRQRP